MNVPENPLEELSLDQLRRRRSMKWRTYPADVLPLWVAEMDVRLAQPIAEVLHEAVEAGDTGYPVGSELAEALGEFAVRRWGWDGVVVDRSAVVADVMTGVVHVLDLITAPGDPVIVNSPVYSPFYAFVSHAGRRIVEAPLGKDLRICLETLEETFRRTRELGGGAGRIAYLMSNPHNPTGTVHTVEELTAVAALARRYGVRVIADEIHAPLVLRGSTFTPYLSVPGAENAFSLMSATKGFSLAGLKSALAIAGPEAAVDLRQLPAELYLGASYLGVLAHTAAYRHGDDWLDALLSGLDANRTLLAELIAEHLPGVEHVRPEGTHMAWLDCRCLGLDPAQDATRTEDVSDLAGPARLFFEHGKVALSSGHIFGTGGTGHVRLNFATSSTILTEALTRMGQAAALSLR